MSEIFAMRCHSTILCEKLDHMAQMMIVLRLSVSTVLSTNRTENKGDMMVDHVKTVSCGTYLLG